MSESENSTTISPALEYLEPEEWLQRQEEHRSELDPILSPWLKKRSEQEKNPVMDFLFEYYSFRPTRLMRWSPGSGRVLIKGGQSPPDIRELKSCHNGFLLDPHQIPKKRRGAIQWMLRLLKETREREPSFGCFGMHEWAMVYRTRNVRHHQLPLRMRMIDLARFVESRPLLCTHYDAWRFFTPEAKPLNRYSLSRETVVENEQPGCLHSNMDLYKWSYKLDPWIPGKITREAFLLAAEARIIDMKASPYDLRDQGLEPIMIETEEGRLEYLENQRAIHKKGIPVRDSLINEYERVLNLMGRQ